jgi:hypothetical protein
MTRGSLSLGGNNLTCGAFVCSGTATGRTLTFAGGQIYLTGDGITVLNLSGKSATGQLTVVGDAVFNVSNASASDSAGRTVAAMPNGTLVGLPDYWCTLNITGGTSGCPMYVPSNDQVWKSIVSSAAFTGSFLCSGTSMGVRQDFQVYSTGFNVITLPTNLTIGAGSPTGTTTLTGFIGANVTAQSAPCNVNCSFITSLTGASSSDITLTGNTTVQGAIVSNKGFNANNYNLTASSFSSSNFNTRTISMGSGTWTLTGSGVAWNIAEATGLTLNCNTSTISLTSMSAKNFIGGGQTYRVLNQAGSADPLADPPVPYTIGDLYISGNNTFYDITNSEPTVPGTIAFTAGSNNSFSNFSLQGSPGSLTTITSSSAAQHTLTKIGGGIVQVGYCNISYSNATPAGTWYAAP